MPFTTHVLVVANQTVESAELAAHLGERARCGPLRATLILPVDRGHREAAQQRLEAAVGALRGAAIDASGSLSDEADPVHAAIEAYAPAKHDVIVVVTLPAHLSRWLGCDVPRRVARATGALVEVVETREAPVAMRG